MSRRLPQPRPKAVEPEPIQPREPVENPPPARIRPLFLTLIVGLMLAAHVGLANLSLRTENPTVDEVNHLPAGLTYLQTGKFKVYHQNPPLFKLIAALPVLWSGVETGPLYESATWKSYAPAPAYFGHEFMKLNAPAYLELFTTARSVMPLFSVIGGVVVFLWSRRLWGDRGGLLSLALWCLCPNVLAHGRLVTSDVAAASIGAGATYAFWRYLHGPSWWRAALAGLLLGVAQLTKFSLLLLYGIWPLLWLIHESAMFSGQDRLKRLMSAAGQGAAMVALSILVIDLGYGFEGVGRKLGTFDFASRSFLTREGVTARQEENRVLSISWQHRVNRFRGTWLGSLPSPLPSEYLLGFDEQKIDADGLPISWFKPWADPDEAEGYPVYLDGELRRHGWRDYYLRAFLYKTPEGTLFLIALSWIVPLMGRRCRASGSDEAAIYLPPTCFFLAMTFLTDINLGIRYVLPVVPYIFIGCGRLLPWIEAASGRIRITRFLVVAFSLVCTMSALTIHPHYLAYFNKVSGGPDRTPPRLIDSNLDWGQDLVGLRRWLAQNDVKEPIGLAYFGQIPPNLFALRGEGFPWFLPTESPGTFKSSTARDPGVLIGPAKDLRPGLYAISASLVAGLPWRVYDPAMRIWGAAWEADEHAFGYFRQWKPIARIGHSILIYRVTQEQADRFNFQWKSARTSPPPR